MTMQPTWQQRLQEIAPTLSELGAQGDRDDRFAADNYQLLKQNQLFSALVPRELGGGGASFAELCALLSQLAGYHPSTALSCAMHQHIVAANRYNYLHGKPGQALLEKVAANELVLVSTGAGDWLASSGSLLRTADGFLLNGYKHFASGSPAGDILVTSAPYQDPEAGWQVLHFPLSLHAAGVTVMDNWQAMGMRGTGSNSVKLENVFVPKASVVLRRPRGDYHALWSVVLPVAMSLIMSVYLGIARNAAKRARERCADSADPTTPLLVGEMENALTEAEVMVESMITIVDEFRFDADLATANEILKRKTLAAAAAKRCVEKAMECCGGQGYLRSHGIESLLRDVQAAAFHPLQEKRQLLFSGHVALGKEPPSQLF